MHFQNEGRLWTKIYTVNPETTWEKTFEQDGNRTLSGFLETCYRDHGSNPVMGTRLRSHLGKCQKSRGLHKTRRGRINYRKTSSWCSFLSCHIADTGQHLHEDFTDYSPFKIRTKPSKSVKHNSN